MKKNSKNILLILCILVLLGMIEYFTLIKKEEISIPNKNLTKDSSTIQPTIKKSSQTVSWETYNNSKYSFKFQYPNNLKVTEAGPYISQSGTQPDNLGTIFLNSIDSPDPLFTIQIFNPDIVQGDYGWPERPCGEWTFGPDGKAISSDRGTFGDAEYKTLYVKSKLFSHDNTESIINFYCINKTNNPLVLIFDESQADLAHKIFSTFVFTK